jgi:putative membrane protein
MMGDPRVFFAAERTLLAWVRTGLTIMAFGFVVARFGLFLRLLAAQQGQGVPEAELHNRLSNAVGIALVLIGVACMILGAVQHKSYVATLRPTTFRARTRRSTRSPSASCWPYWELHWRSTSQSRRRKTVCASWGTVRKPDPHTPFNRV